MKIYKILFCAALFAAGFCEGMCVKVFMERGVPVVNGGGEVLLILAIPASVFIGIMLGYERGKQSVSKHKR